MRPVVDPKPLNPERMQIRKTVAGYRLRYTRRNRYVERIPGVCEVVMEIPTKCLYTLDLSPRWIGATELSVSDYAGQMIEICREQDDDECEQVMRRFRSDELLDYQGKPLEIEVLCLEFRRFWLKGIGFHLGISGSGLRIGDFEHRAPPPIVVTPPPETGTARGSKKNGPVRSDTVSAPIQAPNVIIGLRSSKRSTPYREPFAGAGITALRMLANGREKVWINEIDKWMFCLWQAYQLYPEKLKGGVRSFNPTINGFYRDRDAIHQGDPVVDGVDAIVEAALTTLSARTLTWGSVLDAHAGPFCGRDAPDSALACRWNPMTICRKIDRYSALLAPARITSQDFSVLIQDDSEHAILFLDPPYFNTGLDFYRHGFSKADHVRLRNLLRETEHSWILYYDDHEAIRDMYAFADINCASARTNLGASCHRKKGGATAELLITPRR